jgi:hypothetical protein
VTLFLAHRRKQFGLRRDGRKKSPAMVKVLWKDAR